MSLPRVCICRLVGNRLDVVSSREGERQHEPRSLLADTTLPCHLRIDNREYIRGTITVGAVLWSRRMCLRFDWLVLAAHNRVWHCGHCEATTIQLIIIYARSASKSIIYHRHKCGESRFLSHSGAPVQWDHPLPRIAPHRFTSHPSLITLALWNAHLSPRIRLFMRGATRPPANRDDYNENWGWGHGGSASLSTQTHYIIIGHKKTRWRRRSALLGLPPVT